ncbi:CDP-diacylglycerol--serine O-phosphatidyltransferase [uncultured Alistipes sp.]|uniref:CDP-diacylglycerol--serine O-phosphatidyltransferase n=1 Tax=uncultured Alistipes sp. TaxID=538949 RepID=UPI00266514D7|nr:CDP-diacylglycerol--serine O-phosphatidyltransferase [uncultured Alistipes sp.]
MKIKLFTIPNLLTLANLLCGSVAAVAALVWGELTLAFGLVVLAAVFDFFDGFVARLLHQSSPIGLQLDSLADDVSFGFAPAAVMFALYGQMSGVWLPDGEAGLVVFLFTACGALRLARFNIDDTQRTEFLGLPIPAAAMLCASLGMLAETYGMAISREVIVAAALVASWLMVSNLRMFALKFHGFGWRDNGLRYGFLAASALLLALLGGRAIPLVVVLYVLVSVAKRFVCSATDCGQEG